MKTIGLLAVALCLVACSPSTTVNTSTSEYYWPADGADAVLISGQLGDDVRGYAIGAANTRHLKVMFNGDLVAEGYLSDVYEGQLTGTYQGQDVNVVCHYPVVSGMWREVRCSVQLDGKWAATLTF